MTSKPYGKGSRYMKKARFGQFAVFALIILLAASCSFQRTDLHGLATSEPGISVFADYLALPNGSGEYDYGIMGVLDTGETWFTIQNNGKISATISSVTLSSGDVSQFEIDTSSTTYTIEPGESTQFCIRFKPTEGGDKQATVSIKIQDGGVYTFTIHGHGAASKIVVIREDSTVVQNGGTGYNFGSCSIGSYCQETFTVRNEGDFELRITGLLLQNSDAAQFVIESDSLNSIVPPQNTTTFSVKYKPTKMGLVSTTLVLISNDPENIQFTFFLAGTGQSSSAILPDIQVSLGPVSVPYQGLGYNFGSVQVDQSSIPVTFTIANVGGAGALDLSIYDIDIITGDTADFSVDTATTATYVQEGGITTFAVLFEPQSIGPRQATVRITSDDPDEGYYEFTVTGTATGVATPDIHIIVKDTGENLLSEIGVFDFGNVWIGDTAGTVFTVENTGTTDLTLTPPVSVTGSAFTSTTPPAIIIKPGGSSDFDVQFSPSVAGSFSETVSISSNDPDDTATGNPYQENPYYFTVQGTGNDVATADIAVRQGSNYIQYKYGIYDFGSCVIGTSKPVTFTIENNGSAGLNVNKITSTDPSQFSVSPSSLTVPVVSTATLDITFTPQNTRNQKATITLDNDDPDTPQYTFTVTGTGTDTTEPDIQLFADGQQITKSYKGFEDTAIGKESPPVAFTIENRGTADLDISSIILTKGEKDFRVDLQGTSLHIPEGGSTIFHIIFTPVKKVKRTGILEINSNDPDTASLTISLQGIGM
jgi:hypothetical protein